jgi:hypothetical protein
MLRWKEWRADRHVRGNAEARGIVMFGPPTTNE